MADGHSFLSPSSAPRWFFCSRSAALCDQIPDAGSVYASEGTDAHRLAQYKLNAALGRPDTDPRPNLKYLTQEMEDATDEYVQFILEKIAAYKAAGTQPAVFIDQLVDLRKYVPQCMGTADCLIIAGDEITVIDLKFGMVKVPATSLQLRLYALGACTQFSALYAFGKVRMAVFQPRISNVDETEMSVKDLLSWAENELAPRAKLAFDGAGEFNPGEWCRNCRARRNCRALAMYELELAKYGNVKPELLSDGEIAEVLSRAAELVAWANGVQAFALEQALNGHVYPGFKVVRGKGHRKFTDDEEVARRVEAEGKNPWLKKLVTLTDLEKLLGKKKFSELLSDLITRSEGKPSLVKDSDARDEEFLGNVAFSVYDE